MTSADPTEGVEPQRHVPAPTGDIVSAEVRSEIMRAVGQRDTSAEMAVRRILTAVGIGYRTRNRDLPGAPDIANRLRAWAIFVNGCFWHGHKNCSKTKSGRSPRVPKGNRGYWKEKFVDNRERDARKVRELRNAGFDVTIVWECELADPEALAEKLVRLRPEAASDG